jgi:CelD/BcsL family acetyltransferase involved in cellulose biosynthesis
MEDLLALWSSSGAALAWTSPFVLPPWLMHWWTTFGAGQDLLLWEIRDGDRLLGIAPLRVAGDTARFMGSADLCDYQDFIVSPGVERYFFDALLHLLKERGIPGLDLNGLRPDSATMLNLPAAAEARGRGLVWEQEDVSYELALPSSWEAYLSGLPGKERHEIHRKFRRLNQSLPYGLETVETPSEVEAAMDEFIRLFKMSRPEKAAFLSEAREGFLRGVSRSLAELGLVKLHFLQAGGSRVASALCFDMNGSVYLYNSGMHPDYRDLSAGLLCKLLTLRQSLEAGRKTYDFLKGAETYKGRLGARPVPLYRCRLDLE